MATSNQAMSLLAQLQASGAITESQFAILNAAIDSQKNSLQGAAHGGLYIPGNITIQASHRRLEAVSQVFNTAELLEQILIQLPPADLLLRVQRTSRGVKHIIDTSPSLRRKLYRAPDYGVGITSCLPLRMCGVEIKYACHTRAQPYYYFRIEDAIYHRMNSYPTMHHLLLTQPPLQNVHVELELELELEPDISQRNCVYEQSVAVGTEAGVTVADVLKGLGSMREKAEAKIPSSWDGKWFVVISEHSSG